MGMFDTLYCKYPLPDKELQDKDFQTKDFGMGKMLDRCRGLLALRLLKKLNWSIK